MKILNKIGLATKDINLLITERLTQRFENALPCHTEHLRQG